MVTANGISKRFANGEVLVDVTFSLQPGEKVGLVGPNGGGKSTLLRILAGLDRADRGSVRLEKGATVGYMPQQMEVTQTKRVDEVLAAAQGDWLAARRAFETAVTLLSSPNGQSDQALEIYAAALERFEGMGGYDLEQQMEKVKSGLGIGEIALDQRVNQLSGGEKTRVSLGSLLLSGADVLLLDEPTNHLDLPALQWLETYISSAPQAAIIVSHDREFLDRTVTRILELDSSTHRMTIYPGGYTDYFAAKQRERSVQEARYRDQVERVEKVEREIRALKNQARKTEQGTIHFHYRKIAKGVARRATVQERRMQRSLDSEERIERTENEKRLYLGSLVNTGIGDQRLVLAARGISCVKGDRTILDHVDVTLKGGDRIALTGPNGSGKTTLLDVLSGEIEASGELRLGTGVTVGYLLQEHFRIEHDSHVSVLEAMRRVANGEESAIRAVLDQFLFTGQEVQKRVQHLSYGERLRLELAKLVGAGANVLLLDEPTNHLDLPAIERLQAALAFYRGPLVVVSHDRAFVAGLGITSSWIMEHRRVRVVDRANDPTGELKTVS